MQVSSGSKTARKITPDFNTQGQARHVSEVSPNKPEQKGLEKADDRRSSSTHPRPQISLKLEEETIPHEDGTWSSKEHTRHNSHTLDSNVAHPGFMSEPVVLIDNARSKSIKSQTCNMSFTQTTPCDTIVEVIDLTASSTPRSPSTPKSMETRKRRRSSVTSKYSDSSTTSESCIKVRRTSQYETHLRTPMKSTQTVKVSPLPPASSQLTELSRTPSYDNMENDGFKWLGSTQERALVVQSSQSDENVEVEDVGASFTIQVDGAGDERDASLNNYESDSDSSLDDIIVILKRNQPIAGVLSPPRTAIKRKSSMKSNKRPGIVLPPTPVYKFSLDNLLKHNKRDSKAQIEIEKAKAAIADHYKPHLDHEINPSGGVNSHVLNDVVKQEEGEDSIGRLLHAMGRADVLQMDTNWRFFDDNDAPPHVPTDQPVFPILKAGIVDDALTSLQGSLHESWNCALPDIHRPGFPKLRVLDRLRNESFFCPRRSGRPFTVDVASW